MSQDRFGSELNIGRKIKKLRELKNLTQDYVAKEIGMSQGAYSRLELGETEITYSKLERISQILQMSPEDLISFNESMVFNVMHNQTGNGFVVHHGNLNNQERELYERQIAILKEELEYLKGILNEFIRK